VATSEDQLRALLEDYDAPSIFIPQGVRIRLQHGELVIRSGSSVNISSDGSNTGSALDDGAIIDGGGHCRIFDVLGRLQLTDLVLMGGAAQYGGGLFVRAGGGATLIGTTIANCSAVAGGDLYGNAFGGGIFVSPSASVLLTDSLISACEATNSRAGAMAAGGGLYSLAEVGLFNSLIVACTATAATTSKGEGGGMYVDDGLVLLAKGSLLRRNHASGDGNALVAAGGVTTYQLPAPPGRFVTAFVCLVYRTQCPRDTKGNVLNSTCSATADACSLAPGEVAFVDGTQCRPLRLNQPCDWETTPSLIGTMVEVLPNAPLDADYPFACAAGILGSSEPTAQGSAACDGTCPAGYLCEHPATVELVLCPVGHVCPQGSAVAIPCAPGSWSNATGLKSQAECLPCHAGASCTAGSTRPKLCLPGSFSGGERAELCNLCEPGKYTETSGSTMCKACKQGSLCIEGASAPQPCPGGTHANQTVLSTTGFLSSLDECVVCSAGESCSVGSAEPKDCLPGSYSDSERKEVCDLCPDGMFQDLGGQTACKTCSPGYYCEAGTAKPTPCPAGTASNATGLSSDTACVPVGEGFWAPLGSATPEPCASGFYCPGFGEDLLYRGSKPIIKPVGGLTERWDVEVIEKEITLDVDCNDFDAGAIKAALASQYGIDPALITLDVPAGVCRRHRRGRVRSLETASITFTVEIATSHTDASGAAISVNAVDVIAAVEEVNDGTLGVALGSALGTIVTVESSNTTQATVTKTIVLHCPPGHWCTVGKQIACPRGYYNPTTGAEDQTACQQCPPHATTTATASTSAESCVCEAPYFKLEANVSASMRCERCDSTHPTYSGATECDEPGVRLTALPLARGFWRQRNVSQTVRVCHTPDACLGGIDTTVQCAASQRQGSAYCSVCAANYHGGGDGKLCVACEGSSLLTFLPLLVLAALAVLLVMLALLQQFLVAKDGERQQAAAHSKIVQRSSTCFQRVHRVMHRFGVKLRILIGLIQMLRGVNVAFDIPYPEAYLHILRLISAIELNLPASLPLGCVFEVQYYHKLVIMTAVPLAVLLVLAILIRIFDHGGWTADGAPKSRFAWVGAASNTVLAALLFLLYPSISTSLFSYFICDTLDGEGEDGTRLLRVDYSIMCGSPEYNAFMPYTLLMILVFPIGTPLLYYSFMLQQRGRLSRIARSETRAHAKRELIVTSRASACADDPSDASLSLLAERAEELRSELKGVLRKVTDGYKMSCYWFELFECARKILLVGLPVFLPPGSPGQLLCGLIVSFATVCMYATFEPYIDVSDGRLQLVCQFEIFFALLSSLVLKADPQNATLATLLPLMLIVPPTLALIYATIDECAGTTTPLSGKGGVSPQGAAVGAADDGGGANGDTTEGGTPHSPHSGPTEGMLQAGGRQEQLVSGEGGQAAPVEENDSMVEVTPNGSSGLAPAAEATTTVIDRPTILFEPMAAPAFAEFSRRLWPQAQGGVAEEAKRKASGFGPTPTALDSLEA
jgi:hypothetical protein